MLQMLQMLSLKKMQYYADKKFNRAEMVSFSAIRFDFDAIRFRFDAIRFRFDAIRFCFDGLSTNLRAIRLRPHAK